MIDGILDHTDKGIGVRQWPYGLDGYTITLLYLSGLSMMEGILNKEQLAKVPSKTERKQYVSRSLVLKLRNVIKM